MRAPTSAVSPRGGGGGAPRLLSGTVNFGSKQHDKYFFLVPGEELGGFVSVKVATPTKFVAIRLCLESTLSVKNGWNPNPKPKDEASNAKAFMSRTTRSHFCYGAKQGDDKVRSINFPFKISVPTDATPSFDWIGPSKPDSQVCASCKHRLICWVSCPAFRSRPHRSRRWTLTASERSVYRR